MRIRRFKNRMILILCLVVLLYLILTYESKKYVIWWTGAPASTYEVSRQCGNKHCIFTNDRSQLRRSSAIIIHTNDMLIFDMPLPRLPDQLWALVVEDPPIYVPYLWHERVLQHFNLTSTFSRYSDLPQILLHLPTRREFLTHEYLIGVEEKSRLQKDTLLPPIIFIANNCKTTTGLEVYVRQLMLYIQIDSFGECLHASDLPTSVRNTTQSFMHFLARYKFILIYEDSICFDYITQNFWNAFIVGTVPIYFGSPTAQQWAPNNNSVIYIDEFESPRALANFIMKIDADDDLYATYLTHKYGKDLSIKNKHLSNAMVWKKLLMRQKFLNKLECMVCTMAYQNWRYVKNLKNSSDMLPVSLNHFNCPAPKIYPKIKKNKAKFSDSPLNAWRDNKRSAMIIDKMWRKNRPFSEFELDEKLDYVDEFYSN